DVALQKLPVTFAIDRAGLVGGDGATHQGSYDLSYLRCIPNLVVMAPADENECRQMLFTASQLDQPACVRYPREQRPGVASEATLRVFREDKGRALKLKPRCVRCQSARRRYDAKAAAGSRSSLSARWCRCASGSP